MNAKVLYPLDVINTATEAFKYSKGTIKTAQIEGLIRQILGWREYVRGMYWINMSDILNLNAPQATRQMAVWDGRTRMNDLSKTVSQSLNYAYAHHIQRLMITGNFALLTGLHSD